MSTPMKHAKLSASGSDTWINCPASNKFIQSLPGYDQNKNDSNFYSAEGTVAHKLADEYFSASKEPSEFLNEIIEQESYKITVNEEMVASIEYFIDYVKGIVPYHSVIHSEVKIPLFYSPKEYGTSDIILYDYKTSTLHVVDLKYGKGVRVEALDNTQLLIYGISSMELYGEIERPIKEVVLHIVQPRLNHNPSVRYSLKDLMKWRKKIALAAGLAELDDQPFNPSPEDYCRWCKGKTDCAALADYNYSMVFAMFDDAEPTKTAFPDPNRLTQEQKRNVLYHRSAIEKWMNAIHEETLALLIQGGSFPGFKLVEGRSNRVWTNAQKVEHYLEQFLPTKDFMKTSLRSPTEMEKLLKPKKSPLRKYIEWEEFVEDWVTKDRGKPTLAPESDPRRPLQLNPDDVFDVNASDDDYNYED